MVLKNKKNHSKTKFHRNGLPATLSSNFQKEKKIRNNIIKKIINVTRSLLDNIKTKQLQWYGHVQRMEEGRLPKEVTKWLPPGRRRRSKPKLTWAEGIRRLMGRKGINGRRLE
jgi:hypothetical protein